eukprot:TRINITY_DN3994_c0_g1_i27.p2 TRINITY_DN3994_c0_g1~~TRINITY_DN3994_c0_g1_i27.p2  ORF type:complete len:462 (-),score=111.26 TRINITY_DN3994_c0_g1_i27:3865-5250(-)
MDRKDHENRGDFKHGDDEDEVDAEIDDEGKFSHPDGNEGDHEFDGDEDADEDAKVDDTHNLHPDGNEGDHEFDRQDDGDDSDESDEYNDGEYDGNDKERESAASQWGDFGVFVETLPLPVRVLEIRAHILDPPIVRVCVTATFAVSLSLENACRARRTVPVFRFPWRRIQTVANQTRLTKQYQQNAQTLPRWMRFVKDSWSADLSIARGLVADRAATVPWKADAAHWAKGVLHMQATDFFDHPDEDDDQDDDEDDEDGDDQDLGQNGRRGGDLDSERRSLLRFGRRRRKSKRVQPWIKMQTEAASKGLDAETEQDILRELSQQRSRSKEYTVHITFRQILERDGPRLIFAFGTTSLTRHIRREELQMMCGGLHVDWPPHTDDLESPSHDLIAASSRSHTRVEPDELQTRREHLPSWIVRDFVCAAPISPLWEHNRSFWDWASYILLVVVLALVVVGSAFER